LHVKNGQDALTLLDAHNERDRLEYGRLMERILIIDDDSELCKLVMRFLTGEGFHLDRSSNGSDGVRRALAESYDLILLDVMMPDLSGFDVLRRIRAQSRTPVLMLTARGDTLDRVLGLEMGADDYLPKPFEPSELAARIRAILRRSNQKAAGERPIAIDEMELDTGTRTARRRAEVLDLTGVEFDLLAALMRVAGTTVSREDLVRTVLGREFSPFDRSIDTHVCNLRKKIGRLKDGTERIKGVRGAGYLYAKSVS
jgi:two-component system response regulator CpxR